MLPILFFLLPILSASAMSIDLNNYYYAHTNQPGTKLLTDRSGRTVIQADASNGNGQIVSMSFKSFKGLGSEKLYVVYPDNSKQAISGTSVSLDKKSKSVSVQLVKSTTNETMVELYSVTVDDADSPDYIVYGYNAAAPTTFGSLGKGSTGGGGNDGGGNTGGGDTGGGNTTAKPLNARVDSEGKNIIWDAPPAGTVKAIMFVDGVKHQLASYTKTIYPMEAGSHTYKIQNLDSAGNVIGLSMVTGTPKDTGGTTPTNPTDPDPEPNPGDGGTDPGDDGGNEACPAGCQALKDALECPEFDEYLGKWGDMIASTYPPPPNWDSVASTMRDKIVPAMGQEMVNRSPEIARIIANEFESREKAVTPPPTVPDFAPDVPRVKDVNSFKMDLDQNVPVFTPDYSEDKPFTIDDPMSLDFSDNKDNGYTYKQNGDKPPEYKPAATEPSHEDKGYEFKEPSAQPAPEYKQTETVEQPKDYKTEPEKPEPEYKSGGEHTGDYREYKKQQLANQEYKGTP